MSATQQPLVSALPSSAGRRLWLKHAWQLSAAGLAAAGGPAAWAAAGATALQPLAPRMLVFPRDHGSHPELQTEWWYVTGHLRPRGNAGPAPSHGFQITFFRSRVAQAEGIQSSFAARQLLFAHAAITDLARGELIHVQRMARQGHGWAQAAETDMAVYIGPWLLTSEARGRHAAKIETDELLLDLKLTDSQPLVLQGLDGLSRKGPLPEQASYYYSRPQLDVTGRIRTRQDRAPLDMTGTAWLDHEWSDALLSRDAEGWDWMGINFLNGSALTAFQLRRPDGSALWTGGSWRQAGGQAHAFAPGELKWSPGRTWTSPQSGARYPLAWQVDTPAGRFRVRALADPQEIDARASTGGIYWEGLCALSRADSSETLGYGYLEMTGYHAPLRVS